MRFAERTVDEDRACVLPSVSSSVRKGMEITAMIKKNQPFGQAGLSMASEQHPDIVLLITRARVT